MPAFQTTAQVRAFARLVLAWFVLSLGLAIAAPIVQPQSLTLVCSAAGEVKLQSTGNNDDNGDIAPTGHTLDCVLCLALNAPPPATVDLQAPLPVAVSVQVIQTAARNAWRTAAPLPARGPPASFAI